MAFLDYTGLSRYTDKIKAYISRLYATDASVVHNTGNELISGTKTFNSTISGSISGTAARATADSDGNTINITYATKTELGGKANSSHSHTGSEVTLTGYSKALSVSSVVATDTVNEALGKHEKALDAKAPLISPELSGTPTAPTASSGTNTTQIATTAYVVAEINSKMTSSKAMRFMGTIGDQADIPDYTALPDTHEVGWTYGVKTAGTYTGQVCEIGDLIICKESGTTADDTHWSVMQTNINGAVTGPSSSIADHVVTFNSTTGKIVKDSGFTIGKSVPSNAVFTDTDTKVNVTLDTVHKAYLLGITDTPTSTTQAFTAISDTGVFLDTTAGELTATSFKGDLTGNCSGSSSSCTGNSATATKVVNDLVIKVDTGSTEGTSLYTFNGQNGKTIDIQSGSNVSLSVSSGVLTISATDTTYDAISNSNIDALFSTE